MSVVLPVRDGGPFLADAVASVLNSSLADIELLVVDDHSEDGAVDALPLNDSRVQVFSCPGTGVSAAFNHGFSMAQGQFIARMDADDLVSSDRFEIQLNYLQCNPHVALCGGRVDIMSEQPLGGGFQRYQQWLNQCVTPAQIKEQLFIESPIPNPTAFFRREALAQLGGYHDPDWPEDYDLFLRADAAGLQMGKPVEVVLKWREHGSRLTHTDARYSVKKFQAAKAHYLVHHRVHQRPVVIWGAGPTGRDLCDLLKKEGANIQGFLEVHPRRIGGLKRGYPVWAIDHANQLGPEMILVAVGAAGAREKIAKWLAGIGKVPGQDYLFVA